MLISEIRILLEKMNISFEETVIRTENDYSRLLGFSSLRSSFPLLFLTIRNPHHEKHIHLVFREAEEESAFEEIYFGGFTPDFSRSTEEFLREAIPEFIENVISGRIHIIERHNARDGAWTGDAMFLDSTDEAENDMDEFEAAVRRIKRPQSWLQRLFPARHIHEIYTWTQYERIGSHRKTPLFLSKRQRILQHLTDVPYHSRSSFDQLLDDYLSGDLKEILESFGLRRISFYIDWHDDYRCINIQGRIGSKYADLQIEPDHFSLACDEDEPDDHAEFPLESPGQFYAAAKRLTEE